MSHDIWQASESVLQRLTRINGSYDVIYGKFRPRVKYVLIAVAIFLGFCSWNEQRESDNGECAWEPANAVDIAELLLRAKKASLV